MSRRGALLALLLVAALLALPLVASRYVLSVLILVFYFAYVGQAWNLMMGYAGQLSLGHALYVGLGAYVAALLWLHVGLSPWIGVFAGIATEIARVAFDHLAITGGAGGLFLPVLPGSSTSLWHLQGGPLLFYYLTLALAVGATVLVAILSRSRMGFVWRAIREDPQAAEALGVNLFAAKMKVILLSAGMTAVAGLVNAFYYRNLFPAQSFDMARSLELILAPIVGGLGTVMGPVVGAALLTPLGETLIAATHALGFDAPGAKAVAYGALLLTIIWLKPDGIWPWLARKLGL